MMAAYALSGECPELALEFDALGEQVGDPSDGTHFNPI